MKLKSQNAEHKRAENIIYAIYFYNILQFFLTGGFMDRTDWTMLILLLLIFFVIIGFIKDIGNTSIKRCALYRII